MKFQTLPACVLVTLGAISLFASPEEDRKIEANATSSYNYRVVLDNSVQVKAEDGVLTLSGTVHDQDDKTLAADTVENLPGVTAVRNEIVVKAQAEEKSDAWIALKIRGRLLVKGEVSAGSTEVAVKDGVVTLTGTAENSAQKELTEVYAAEIDGVRSVRNHIAIEPTPPMVVTMEEVVDDASITSQVKNTLRTHRSTRALKTMITTKDGEVVITGSAASEAEKALVTKLVKSIRGVTEVTNDMTISKG